MMGQDVLRKILVRIREAGYFALLADETRDIANKDRLVICCCWVDELYNIHEDPIGLVQISSCTADAIVHQLRDALIRCMLSLTKCRGQGYHGAVTMSGRFRGVSTQILHKEPRAIPVHCLAHNLNLCLQDACKMFRPIRDALDLVKDVVHVINKSPKRSEIFVSKQAKNHSFVFIRSLKPLYPTRWTERTEAISAVLDNYGAVQATMEDVNAEGGDVGIKTGGVLARLARFSTLSGLRLSRLVFSAGEEFTLLSADCNVQVAFNAANLTSIYDKRLRIVVEFNGFYVRLL